MRSANFNRAGAACVAALTFIVLSVTQAYAQGSASRPGNPDQRSGAWWTGAARILAGMPLNDTDELAAQMKRRSVAQHQAAFGQSWERFSKERLAPATAFAAAEMSTHPAAGGPLYYPFSGPDVLYALALFPRASELVLTGLEPVGDLPDLTRLDEPALTASLGELRRSLNAVLSFSFFRTNDMKVEFTNNRFSGVTPIILLFLARHNATISAVDPIIIDGGGNVNEVPASSLRGVAPDRVAGLRVAFRLPGDSAERKLYYFSADISDKGLEKIPQYFKWLGALAPRATFVKSASYLMHKSYFSQVRNFVLDRSALVLQDDSGIPLRFFAEAAWERRMYGAYVGPIQLFANWYQKDMKAAYDKAARPIDFGIGYQFVSRRSNLQLFTRRATVASR